MNAETALQVLNDHRKALGYKKFKRGEIKDPVRELTRVEGWAQYGEDAWAHGRDGKDVDFTE